MNGFDIDDLNQFDEEDDWDKSSLNALSSKSRDIHRYTNQELIATGGMKEIYKTFDTKNSRFVALAKLRSDVPEELCEDFLKEAQLTASLEHPNIITLYDNGVDDQGFPYFTLELKAGDTLGEIISQRNLKNEQYLKDYPYEKLLDIYLKVCDAISYAHSIGVLHLDIKPDNIQVGKFGEVQVCDWGLGSNIEGVTSFREEGVIKGTPGFMAPEQVIGKKLDKQTDIYALGSLLYYLISGNSAYEGGLNTVLFKTIEGDVFFDEKEVNMQISDSLRSVIYKAMSATKDDRYLEVEELKKDIEYYLSGRSTLAEEASFMKELKLFYKRNVLICTVVIISVLFVTVGSNLFLLKIKESNDHLKVSNEKVRAALTKSEKNYSLFEAKVLEEKKLTEDLLLLNSNTHLQKFQYPMFYTDLKSKPMAAFDEIVADSVNSILVSAEMIKTDEFREKLIYTLFVIQNFSEVLNLKESAIPELTSIARKYAKLKSSGPSVLSNENFLKLIKDINDLGKDSISKALVERMLVYQLKKTGKAYAGADIVKQLIKAWNPSWDETNFGYDKKTFHLYLSGNNLVELRGIGKYGARRTFLRHLKIEQLDLSGSSIESFEALENLQASTLDIRNTHIKD
ncbi:MAG: serine/threonine protein kinase, partial [Lentisphaeraceae bacterium]|nr:serine/threonine protein kinase [Lentisphaeraceae bacterium]